MKEKAGDSCTVLITAGHGAFIALLLLFMISLQLYRVMKDR